MSNAQDVEFNLSSVFDISVLNVPTLTSAKSVKTPLIIVTI